MPGKSLLMSDSNCSSVLRFLRLCVACNTCSRLQVQVKVEAEACSPGRYFSLFVYWNFKQVCSLQLALLPSQTILAFLPLSLVLSLSLSLSPCLALSEWRNLSRTIWIRCKPQGKTCSLIYEIFDNNSSSFFPPSPVSLSLSVSLPFCISVSLLLALSVVLLQLLSATNEIHECVRCLALPNAICDAREQTVPAEIMQTCNQDWQQLVVLLLLFLRSRNCCLSFVANCGDMAQDYGNFTQLSHENKPRRRITAHLPHLPLQLQQQKRGEKTEMQLMILTTFFWYFPAASSLLSVYVLKNVLQIVKAHARFFLAILLLLLLGENV